MYPKYIFSKINAVQPFSFWILMTLTNKLCLKTLNTMGFDLHSTLRKITKFQLPTVYLIVSLLLSHCLCWWNMSQGYDAAMTEPVQFQERLVTWRCPVVPGLDNVCVHVTAVVSSSKPTSKPAIYPTLLGCTIPKYW